MRYHTLQDPQLHNTLKDLLASVKAPGKGLGLVARLYLARRESVLGGGGLTNGHLITLQQHSVCLSAGLRAKPEFLTLVEQQYGVRPKGLAGGAKDAPDINEWVAQQTGRKVQRFLTKPFTRSPNPGVNPISAAYFKGSETPPQKGGPDHC